MNSITIAPTTRWIESNTNIVVMNKMTGRYYRLNEAGNLIWSALTASVSEAEIEARMQMRYGIPLEQARLDTARFLEKIHEVGLIERGNKATAVSA